MAHDTTDSSGFTPNSTGDLFDVSSTTPTVAGSHLIWSATDNEYKVTAPSAAFADIGGAPSQANFNALLAILRTHGIIAP